MEFEKEGEQKKGFVYLGEVLLAILLILLLLFIVYYQNLYEHFYSCGDGTLAGMCSKNKPYLCDGVQLIEKASICGCPDSGLIEGNSCTFNNWTEPKKISLEYVLEGEKSYLDFVIYGGLIPYFEEAPRSLTSRGGVTPTRKDFEILKIDDKTQKQALIPLVVEIQNMAKDKEDQARIATSLVQRIDYGNSVNVIDFMGKNLTYARYPYEVLYDEQGVCGEKSELLVFLLQEIGYGTAIIYYPFENHQAVGIKCPVDVSFDNSGYCFIETTYPSIISSYPESWRGIKLSPHPEIISISEGDILKKNTDDLNDAKTLKRLNDLIKRDGELNVYRFYRRKAIMERYGLA